MNVSRNSFAAEEQFSVPIWKLESYYAVLLDAIKAIIKSIQTAPTTLINSLPSVQF